MNLRIVLVALLTFAAAPALAASGAALQPAHTNVGNQASLQRGAALFMNYCSSCHSMQYLRYSRLARDLGLTEEQVMQHLNMTGAKFGEPIRAAMSTTSGETFFGKAPPDLTLTARSRGVDWIYTYLKSFYADDSRSVGWNNTILPGASMPHVLWELQGVQRLADHGEGHAEGEAEDAHGPASPFELAAPGKLGAAEYDEVVRDITTFMQYAAEPAALEREKYGVWVVLFLAALTFLLWLLKHEYWRDVH